MLDCCSEHSLTSIENKEDPFAVFETALLNATRGTTENSAIIKFLFSQEVWDPHPY